MPWPLKPPSGAVEIKPPDDVYLTLERWPKEAFDRHFHDAFNWLVPMRPGEIVVAVGGREFRIDGNHWICIFPNVPHEVKSVSDGAEVLSIFFSHIEMREALGDREIPNDGPEFIVGGKGTIAQGLALQWAESRLPDADTYLLRPAFTRFLCPWIWSFYGKALQQEESLEVFIKLKMDEQGPRIWKFLEKNLSESPFPWEVLAQQFKTSQRTLQRSLGQKLGMTPSELLTACRIEFSKRLLADPDVELADIALKAGFSSQSHFSTLFKAATGSSPRQFRLMLAEKL